MHIIFSEEVLLAIAQIAIALIGFSGVITVLGREKAGELSRSELFKLRTMVEPCVIALVGAFIPLGLILIMIPDDHLWRVANALLLCLHAIGNGLFLIRGARKEQQITSSQKLVQSGCILVYVIQISSVANLIPYHELAYLLGLLLGVFIGVHNFYLLLFGRKHDVT
jgi:hypothetical protein